MAPIKSTRAAAKQILNPTASTTMLPLLPRKGNVRRAASNNTQDQNLDIVQTRGKRKADPSPLKNDKIKRSALGNLTNNAKMGESNVPQQEENVKQQLAALKKKDSQMDAPQAPVSKEKHSFVLRQLQQLPVNKVTTRATARNAINTVTEAKTIKSQTVTAEPIVPPAPAKPKKVEEKAVASTKPATQLAVKVQSKPMRRISNEFNKTEDSLYMSALDISSCESMRLSGNFEAAKRRSALLQQKQQQEKIKTEEEQQTEIVNAEVVSSKEVKRAGAPEGVEDFDLMNWNDPFQVSHYAMEIFDYLRRRESEFIITDYMPTQIHLSKWMRSLLVDWMVEVQETFELNHETLYLAVKIVDLYLCRKVINKEKLQLLGASALFISAKFDERTPPLIEDFLYICDGAYKHDELINMEMTTLRTINYDLGIPLSYRFLRRYARCAKVAMPTLTLARYILELSLLDYAIITLIDSQLAAAALFIALRMNGQTKPWTLTLEYYSTYKLVDFADIVPLLNAGLHRKPKGTIKTIRSKYSHKIFHEVALIKLMSTEKLFEHNIDFNVSIQLENENK